MTLVYIKLYQIDQLVISSAFQTFQLSYRDINNYRKYSKIKNKLIKQFDVIYLNLERRLDRRKHMEVILGHLNLDYRRFIAVDYIELASNTNYLASRFDQAKNFKTNQSILLRQTYNRDLSLGQVSCWLSYLFLFSQLASVTTSTRPILILEDDVDVEVDFVNQLNEAISSAPPDWNVLLCGYCYLPGNHVDTKFLRVNDYAGTHCQVMRDSRVAARLVQKLDLITIEKPVDLILANLAGSRYLNFYALKDQLAVQMRHVFSTEIKNSGGTVQYTLKNSLVQYLKNRTLFT